MPDSLKNSIFYSKVFVVISKNTSEAIIHENIKISYTGSVALFACCFLW